MRRTNRSKNLITTGILLIIFAAILICFGTYSHFQYKKLIKACTGTTMGTVTDIQTIEVGKDNHPEYSAVVSFEVSSGKQYTFSTEHRKERFNIGENVTVKYDPNDPVKAYTTEFNPNSGRALAGGGVFLLLIGAASMFIGFKKRIY